MNSDGFVFDQEIIAQVVAASFRIAEIAVPVRYFAEASSASFLASCVYGPRSSGWSTRYLLHRLGLKRSRRLQAISRRYARMPDTLPPPEGSPSERSGALYPSQAAARGSCPAPGPIAGRPRPAMITSLLDLLIALVAAALLASLATGWARPEDIFLALLAALALRLWARPAPVPASVRGGWWRWA